MSEPCKNCIMVPMCAGRLWARLITKCNLLTDYMIKETQIEKCAAGMSKTFYIRALCKGFRLTKAQDEKIYFGKALGTENKIKRKMGTSVSDGKDGVFGILRSED